MFSLLRDAFVNNLPVTADFLIDTGKKNGVAIRIALIRQGTATPAVESPRTGGKVMPGPEAGAKPTTPRSQPKPRKAR